MSIGNKMFKGAIWSTVERLSVQLVSFALTIVLARLLTPKEYGTVGLLIVFISFSQVFIDSGFSKALIQKQNRTNEDISTVFYFNLIVALICYLALWICAPFISDFYSIPKLDNLLKILSISLFFNALFAIPNTLLSIEMNFKSITKVNFISTVISGLAAIYLAYENFGEWALVYQTLIKSVLMALLFWFSTKWKPLFIFSKDSFKNLFGFGSKLLVNSIMNNLVNNFASLFIAKIISAQQLGYYTRGTQNADTAFSTINSIIDNVLLPGLAPLQNQLELLIEGTKKIIKTAALLVVPLFFGLTIISKPLIILLLTDKWALAIPIMQLICLSRLITIISGININLLYVLGRSDLALKQQYFKIAIRIILLIFALRYGIVMIAIAELVSTVIHFFINTYYPGKMMTYGAKDQIRDIFPILISGLVMSIPGLWIVYFTSFSEIVKIILTISTCFITYYLMLRVLKIEEYKMLIKRVTSLLKK
ncbi:lipopolysaccharide biosynthesis protein [Maribacter sp. SA7]|uniref:lipopolysaccharide biosynthesis protein n=1 Tax=Maribacter zhoushanensis TaxID=3030012 RepID=UPI0023EC55C8|nr:lipopolysaccharide biosynthesis protein [Maribacter zhoushanensis]MDF4204132.1 lipopolysaccharide biosynthesis protein [Maribacter zhoushanensis]